MYDSFGLQRHRYTRKRKRSLKVKMLYIVGLGLGNEKDITLRGLEAVKKCDKIYMEAYTSLLSFGLSSDGLSTLVNFHDLCLFWLLPLYLLLPSIFPWSVILGKTLWEINYSRRQRNSWGKGRWYIVWSSWAWCCIPCCWRSFWVWLRWLNLVQTLLYIDILHMCFIYWCSWHCWTYICMYTHPYVSIHKYTYTDLHSDMRNIYVVG